MGIKRTFLAFCLTATFLGTSLVASSFVCFFHDQNGEKTIGNSAPPGIGGTGPFESQSVELLSQLLLADVGAVGTNVIGNECWGWVDPLDGKEYAIMGLTNATSFVDISDPFNPIYLGKLMTHTGNAAWRDFKIFDDHCFVVSDGNNAHGMQIFNLKKLRNVTNPPVTFTEDAHYSGVTNCHNVVINEDTGYAYLVGSNRASGGLHIVDINDPLNPTEVGNFSTDGYTHDAQVVSYTGPDAVHLGKEIAFCSNTDTLTIVDVTTKSNTIQISRNAYPNSEYSHQGWLSDDQKYFFMDDELDEWRANPAIQTRLRVWDVQDLDNPTYLGHVDGTHGTIDHNLYTRGNYILQANYTSGLRVLRTTTPGDLNSYSEVAYFDSYNTDNNISFNGAWSNYPFFPSGVVLISDRQNGLFITKLGVPRNCDAFSMLTGSVIQGVLGDTYFSDDNALVIRRAATPPTSKAVATFEGSLGTDDPNFLEFEIESSATVEKVRQVVSMYNWSSSQFETVHSAELATMDARISIDLLDDKSKFVQAGTGNVKAKIHWLATSRVIHGRVPAVWDVKIDQLDWRD